MRFGYAPNPVEPLPVCEIQVHELKEVDQGTSVVVAAPRQVRLIGGIDVKMRVWVRKWFTNLFRIIVEPEVL